MDVRTEFEHWFSDNGKFPKAVERSGDGGYKLMSACSAWKAWQAAAEAVSAQFRMHYLAHIECDEENKRDRPTCACSMVDLGWHDSVGAAVDAWHAHVVAPNRHS